MSQNIKRIGEHRSFLNEPYLTSLSSNISYRVVINAYDEKLINEGLFNNAHISFSMSDCNKNIYLEFNIEDKENMRNSLFKLNTIIDTCIKMKKDLKEARLLILEGKKRQKELDSIKK